MLRHENEREFDPIWKNTLECEMIWWIAKRFLRLTSKEIFCGSDSFLKYSMLIVISPSLKKRKVKMTPVLSLKMHKYPSSTSMSYTILRFPKYFSTFSLITFTMLFRELSSVILTGSIEKSNKTLLAAISTDFVALRFLNVAQNAEFYNFSPAVRGWAPFLQ